MSEIIEQVRTTNAWGKQIEPEFVPRQSVPRPLSGRSGIPRMYS